jgi:hypothetical protein
MSKFTLKSDLYIGNYCNNSFEHSFPLTETAMNNIKAGNNLTDEAFDFFIVDFVTRSLALKKFNNSNSNFIIITEKFLEKNFYFKSVDNESMSFIKVNL